MKYLVEAIAHLREGDQTILVRGQVAKALIALVHAGDRGVTASEVATWAFRFAAYCHQLRTRCGLHIRTEREEHAGGWHGRHVLETPVTIRLVVDPERDEEKPRPSWWQQLASGFTR